MTVIRRRPNESDGLLYQERFGLAAMADLEAARVGGVHDNGARGLIPAAAQRLIHHHLGHHTVHLHNIYPIDQSFD